MELLLKKIRIKEDGENDIKLTVKAAGEKEIFGGLFYWLSSLAKNTKNKKKMSLHFTADSLENLAVKIVNEVIYLYDYKKIWPLKTKIKLENKKNIFILKAEINAAKNAEIKRQLKAASYHGLCFKKERNGFVLKIVIDI
ncbi:MAG: archease [Elusimicrobia bacterium]|nr:archease [Elusimicrobiota bacterium]